MAVELSDAELNMLDEILTNQLGELKEEIYKAEVADFKAGLKEREVILTSLLERLRAARPRTS